MRYSTQECAYLGLDLGLNMTNERNETPETLSSDAKEQAWHWIRRENWGGLTKWVPAQRQGNHWNSSAFSGIPHQEVIVGPELVPPPP
jgi:hypothetical protein